MGSKLIRGDKVMDYQTHIIESFANNICGLGVECKHCENRGDCYIKTYFESFSEDSHRGTVKEIADWLEDNGASPELLDAYFYKFMESIDIPTGESMQKRMQNWKIVQEFLSRG